MDYAKDSESRAIKALSFDIFQLVMPFKPFPIRPETVVSTARAVLAHSMERAVNPAKRLSLKEREEAWAWLLRPVYSSEPPGEDGMTVEQTAAVCALPLWPLLEGIILAGSKQLDRLFGKQAKEQLLAAARDKAHRAIN